MNKILLIAWKDLTLTFYDRAAWIMMLAAPFVLTLGLGAVTGAFSQDGSSGLSEIPIVIVNQDEGQLGNFIVGAFESEQLEDLFSVAEAIGVSAARQQVEDDLVAAAIVIPPGFSAGLIPDWQTGETGPAAPVEVYANPGRPISAALAQSVVTEIVNRIESAPVSGQVIIEQMLISGRLSPQDIPDYARDMAVRLAAQGEQGGAIAIVTDQDQQAGAQEAPSLLAYLAPGMAIFFLMYTVTLGGRSILTERDHGTLARMLSTPTSNAQVLGGKVLGVYITGFLQVSVLILASSLLFGLRWGDPLGVATLVLAVTAAASGWGILLASFARTPFQVTSIGTAMMLVFGILGGIFIPASSFSDPVRLLSKITPNAWAMDGFAILADGGALVDLLDPIWALLSIATILFIMAVGLSRRRWISGFAK